MADDPLIGQQLANFRIERLLGQGGMAQVYFGHDVKLRRPVAIKVIDARFRGNVSYAERFVREARTIALWRHENIVQVYYADEQDGLYYYAMEYIAGPDLAQLLAEYASAGELMPHEDARRIGRAVASALDYAHAQAIIHRDVKPSNVMVASDGRVVLTDFGLALDVEQGTMGEVFGTPHYIAPEQARRSSDAVPQSDIYAWGVVLYEMLTGVVPFDDPSPTSVALQHLTMPPPPPRQINPALNEETEEVLLKALSKTPADRYQTVGALMDALEAALRSAPAQTAPAALPPVPAEMQEPPRSLSRQTVAERVAQYVAATHTPAIYPEPLVPPTQQRSAPASTVPPRAEPRRRGWIAAGALLVIALAAALFFVWQSGDNGGKDAGSTRAVISITDTPAETPIPTETRLPTETITITSTPTEPEPVAIVPSATAAAVETLPPPTDRPTDTPVPTATLPPPTSTLTPTDTPAPTATFTLPPPTPIPQTLEPTILYPNGRRLALSYDETTFYVRNLSADQLEVRHFAFERLDSAGNPANRTEGVRWAQFYSFLHPQACMRAVILDQPDYLSPPSCQAINSEIWAEDGRSFDFWTAQEGSTQFRVLWNNEEIGRCDISAGTCEVFIP
jgi:serine/threonine protein kinase